MIIMDNIYTSKIVEYTELFNALVCCGGGCRLPFPAITIGGHQMNFGRRGE